MKVEIDITDDTVLHVLDCASTAVRHWASEFSHRPGRARGVWRVTIPRELVQTGSAEAYVFNWALVVQGVAAMRAVCPREFARLLRDDYDHGTADILVQCILFGELRYG